MLQKIKDIYVDVKWFFKKLFYSIGNLIFYFRTIWNDQPWDFGYMLALEHRKIKRMLQWWAHEENTHLENYWKVYRDLKLADKLLDIIEEEGQMYLELLDEGEWDETSKDVYELKESPKFRFNHYVYTGNASRFMNDYLVKKLNDSSLRESLKSNLYNEKAWHLYHLLRKNNMRNWWD